MNKNYIPTTSIDELLPVRDTLIQIDEWIMDEFMYEQNESLKVYKPSNVDSMIYDVLNSTNGQTFI